MKSELEKAEMNYKRAQTRHDNEQWRGQSDLSVKQTRRMYHATQALGRALWRLSVARREMRRAMRNL